MEQKWEVVSKNWGRRVKAEVPQARTWRLRTFRLS